MFLSPDEQFLALEALPASYSPVSDQFPCKSEILRRLLQKRSVRIQNDFVVTLPFPIIERDMHRWRSGGRLSIPHHSSRSDPNQESSLTVDTL